MRGGCSDFTPNNLMKTHSLAGSYRRQAPKKYLSVLWTVVACKAASIECSYKGKFWIRDPPKRCRRRFLAIFCNQYSRASSDTRRRGIKNHFMLQFKCCIFSAHFSKTQLFFLKFHYVENFRGKLSVCGNEQQSSFMREFGVKRDT